ncbi:MAG: hypothetical protein AB1Z98_11150 [Nannocystaceae bacterium]
MTQAPHVDPVIRPVRNFAGARDHATPTDRLAAIRRAAREFREQMLDGPVVRLMRSFDLVKVPYPTRYGLRDACSLPVPYIHILNRLFVVQFDTPQGVKTLLAEPLDRHGNARTPFFHRLGRKVGGAQGAISRMMWPDRNDVASCLEQLGLTPDDVDYITYDHLHTQDLRHWLGTATRKAFFPRAKLLVMRQEWMSAQGLLPTQADWYCPHGTEGIPDDRVILLDDDVMLGDSVALVRTPGHTEGNHSIVVHTPQGLFVTSENGVCADSYAPDKSAIPGLRRYASVTGAEVVLNGNTLEGSVDQYLSMVQEKEIAGCSERDPDFFNVAPSSEMSAHPLSPGLSPTFTVGELSFGEPVTAR